MAWPRVLIYKRNHTGDPDASGTFGCRDCMGKIRGYRYDAVIGIGVSQPWPGFEGIADRISWVGVGPRSIGIHPARNAPLVRFERWKVFNAGGKDFRTFAPHLAEYFYAKHRRHFFSDGLADEIQRDIARILKLATHQSAKLPTGNAPSERDFPPSCPPSCPPKSRLRRKVVC